MTKIIINVRVVILKAHWSQNNILLPKDKNLCKAANEKISIHYANAIKTICKNQSTLVDNEICLI